MPNTLITNQSGGQQLYSGASYSGQGMHPVGSVLLVWDSNASGLAYVSMSGLMYPLSGAAQNGGMPMQPGASYQIPRLGVTSANNPQASGTCTIHICADATCSGLHRMWYELF